ncbi:MAG: HlyC/CorC family transporter [Planctomycetes bacterium]|nr:HlyC/CorC family transporter [Planctomycetota bacterium]
MDPATAFWIGAATVILTFCWIAYVSVVGEALRGYALSRLFELIPEADNATQRRFETLCARDDEFLQVTEVGRIIGFVAHFVGWCLLMIPIGTAVSLYDLGLGAGLSIVSLVVCVLILPPLLLRHREESALLALLPVFAWLALPFKPLTAISSSLRRIGARIEGVKDQATPEESFQEDLADSLEQAERGGLLEESEREMVHNVLELSGTPATRAMIPRTEMVFAFADDTPEEAMARMVSSRHDYLPVCDGNRDNIVGMVYARDLFVACSTGGEARPATIRGLAKPARFWPETKSLSELLQEMRAERLKMGVLLDEHGGTAGLISLEDVLDRILGYAAPPAAPGVPSERLPVAPFAGEHAEADGDVDIDQVNAVLQIELPHGPDYNSLAGLILHRLGHLPQTGESLQLEGLLLTVLDADERRVKRVKISRAPSTETV